MSENKYRSDGTPIVDTAGFYMRKYRQTCEQSVQKHVASKEFQEDIRTSEEVVKRKDKVFHALQEQLRILQYKLSDAQKNDFKKSLEIMKLQEKIKCLKAKLRKGGETK